MNTNNDTFVPVRLEMQTFNPPCNHTRLKLCKESSTFYVCKDCGKEVERKVIYHD